MTTTTRGLVCAVLLEHGGWLDAVEFTARDEDGVTDDWHTARSVTFRTADGLGNALDVECRASAVLAVKRRGRSRW